MIPIMKRDSVTQKRMKPQLMGHRLSFSSMRKARLSMATSRMEMNAASAKTEKMIFT
jgi:hypothetical protein